MKNDENRFTQPTDIKYKLLQSTYHMIVDKKWR